MPVSSISTAGLCSSNLGGSLCIVQCSSFSRLAPPSIVSPNTLKSLPSVASPTGTLIPSPVATTSMSLLSPSEAVSMIHLTMFPPWCEETSIRHFLPWLSTYRASLIFGTSSSGNRTSTTGPITCIILPFFILISSNAVP